MMAVDTSSQSYRPAAAWTLCLVALLAVPFAQARVVRVIVEGRDSPAFGGQSFLRTLQFFGRVLCTAFGL